MPEPVLVVHGVATRDQNGFNELVADLGQRLAVTDRQLIPVYWGNLGADFEGLDETIPAPLPAAVRAAGEPAPQDVDVALGMLAGSGAPAVRAGTAGESARLAGDAFAGRANSAESVVRAEDVGNLRGTFEEAWAESPWLSQITDPFLLSELGQAAAEAVGVDDQAAESPVRGLNLPGLHNLVKRVVAGLDRAVGAVTGIVGGEINTFARRAAAPGVARFLGDVLVYQRHRAEIHTRLREVLAEKAPGYGVKDKPITVFGHSLGGVISFDIAVAGEPQLWINRLLTFGSQSPFLHLMDPRGGALAPFHLGSPTQLPETIGKWINLWEPLDPLAFIAAKVFRCASGDFPVDRPVHHLASSPLWTHSVYWRSAELLTAGRELLS